jgi:hypothetical protein
LPGGPQVTDSVFFLCRNHAVFYILQIDVVKARNCQIEEKTQIKKWEGSKFPAQITILVENKFDWNWQ